jgi:hypothetical protein
MRFAWLALGAVFLGAAAVAQPAATPSPQAAASAIAGAMQAQLPMEAQGIVMRRVRAEGDLLIVTVELPADATEHNRSEYVRGFMIGVCQVQPAPLFESRVRLRIDTYTQSSAPRQSEIFTRCPGAAPAKS